MTTMKVLLTILLLAFAAGVHAQSSDQVLATAGTLKFTAADLTDEGKQVWNGQDRALKEVRERMAAEMIAQAVLDLEAAARKVTVESLLESEYKKVADPTPEEIARTYEAAKSQLGGRTLEEVRPHIIAHLRQSAESEAFSALVSALKTKYKFSAGKDVNAAGLKPSDAIYSLNGSAVTLQQFETVNRLALLEAKGELYEAIFSDLEYVVLNGLAEAEAKQRNIEPSALIAAEITDKMKEFSDDEQAMLQNAFKKRLFDKYKPVFLLKEPEPAVYAVSADDDPSIGPRTAPVTVIMFSDFQCPACAGTHPLLKRVMDEFPGKVRLVVRDFPLENLHENAFQAALAANAAHAQGKYAEYIELLYGGQADLSREKLVDHAKKLGLNVKQFEIDLNSEKNAAEVRKDMADGTALNIGGTPTIFVNGVKVRRLTADAIRRSIEKSLSAVK